MEKKSISAEVADRIGSFFVPGQKKAPVKKSATPKIKDSGIRHLKLLCTVVNRSKANFYLDMLEQYEVNFQTVVYGSGTADSRMLGYIALTETDKAVIFSVIREDKAGAALAMLEEKFSRVKNGKGVAFTIPFESVMGVHTYCFLSNSTDKK